MHFARLSIVALAIAVLAGCGNLERSRDLGNPNVSATTLAQQVCSNCHGLTGNAVSPNFPRLAGQVEPYVVAQLNGFKSHNRQDPAGFEYMWGLSRHLTDDQIKGLAAYYAAQQPAKQPIEGAPERVGAGKAIFENGLSAKNVPACSTCHGPEGRELRIVDRKKDIMITAGGKNITPSEIENALRISPFIKEAIVIADRRRFVSALLQIDFESVGNWAEAKGLAYTTFKSLVDQESVRAMIEDEVARANAQLAQVQQVRKFHLLVKELDHDDGEVTATMKVRRKTIAQKYADVIEAIYV